MGLCFELQTCPPSTGLNMRFLFVGPGLCLRLPSDSTSRWTPLPLANASCYRARSGLAPPSYRPCRAHNYKKDCVHYGAVLFTYNGCKTGLARAKSFCINGGRSLSHSLTLLHLLLLNSVTLRDSRDSCSISVLSGLSLAFLCCSELRSKGPRSDFSYEPCKKYEKFKENSQENHDFVQNKYLHKTRALE